jgi:site-specific recombinase XerC
LPVYDRQAKAIPIGDRLRDCQTEPGSFDVRRCRSKEPVDDARQRGVWNSATGIDDLNQRIIAVSLENNVDFPTSRCISNRVIHQATLRGIRRAIGAAPGRKAPAVAEVMRDMARIAPLNLKGLRDRALLLMGFSGAFRRSELVALDVADLEETSEGLRVTIRRSKTDQEGVGATIAIIRGGACRPVRALKEWLDAASTSAQ